MSKSQPFNCMYVCMYVCTQIIAPQRSQETIAELRRPPPPPPLRKDIETITAYRKVSPNIIIADQVSLP